MSIRRSLALLAVPAAALALTATPARANTANPHAAPGGTKIIVTETAFGPSLAVGSGPFKNFTPAGGATPVGNGNGIKAFGGTFSLVVNP